MVTAQVDKVPAEHTTAILRSDGSIYASGNLASMNNKWQLLPFEAEADTYIFAVHAIDSKWYRTSWVQFS